MSNLPPSRSWSGNWGVNKVPYPTSGWGSNNKPPRRGGCLRAFKWFVFGALIAIVFAVVVTQIME